MCGVYWVPQRENLITRLEWLSVDQALFEGYDVILDATNLKLKTKKQVRDKYRARRKRGPKVENLKIGFKDFLDVPLKECIRRDKNREKSVGADVINRMYNSYFNEDGNYS